MLKEDYREMLEKAAPSEELEKKTLERMKALSAEPKSKRARPKKALVIAVVSVTAALAIGGGAYAFRPVPEPEMLGGRMVAYAEPIPQEPVKGFARVRLIGRKMTEEDCPKNDSDDEEFNLKKHFSYGYGIYSVPVTPTENGGYIEKIAYDNGETIVICDEDGGGFWLSKGQTAEIEIDIDLSMPYSGKEDGEYFTAGYIFEDRSFETSGGKLINREPKIKITAEKDGEYRFYIINCCAGMQNYRSITVAIK